MSGIPPRQIRIYHIIHLSRLPAVMMAAALWSDAYVRMQNLGGAIIGMNKIKQRRLNLAIPNHPNIHVGDCVPFYFCPRSVMLYVISRKDHPELAYKGGQEDIVHLVADLNATVQWAELQERFWAFTTSNAGSYYFNAYTSLDALDAIDWDAVNAAHWQDCSEGKQAEFLLQTSFPWHLVQEIGVFSDTQQQQVQEILNGFPQNHHPVVRVHREWYY